MRSLAVTVIIFAMSVHPGRSFARSINDGIGTTSFTWLKAISDAEISAAGETMAARDGLAGLLVHPAAVAGIDRGTVKLSYVQYHIDTQFGSIGYATPFRNRDVGVRVTYVNYGDFVRTDESGQDLGTFTAGDLGLSINLGKVVRDDLKIGATVSYLTSKIEDFTAQAATVDLGAIYIPPFEGVTVGAVLMNVGKVFSGYSADYTDKLPTYLTVGMRKVLAHSPIALTADVTFPNDNDISYGFGVEVNMNDRLFAFGGIRSRSDVDIQTQKARTDFGSIRTFGIGLALDRYRFNYAYCPDEDLDAIHKITLGMQVP